MPANTKITSQMLARIPLFSNLDNQERSAILAMMSERSFAPGEIILKAGDSGETFFIIQRGEAQQWLTDTDGKRVVLNLLGPGKFFGEMSLLSGQARSDNVSSTEELVTLELGREDFFDFLRKHPGASLDIIEELGRRLKRSDDILRTRIGPNPNSEGQERLSLGQRVADVIAEFSGSIPFLLINLAAFVIWILINTVAPEGWRFDGYPFQFLTMAVSLEAIFLSIFVLISQNRQAAKDRLKTNMDYQVDVKAELELSQMQAKMGEIERKLEAIHGHVLEVKDRAIPAN